MSEDKKPFEFSSKVVKEALRKASGASQNMFDSAMEFGKQKGFRADNAEPKPKVSEINGHYTYPNSITNDALGFVNYMPYEFGSSQAGQTKSEERFISGDGSKSGPLQINLHMPLDLTDSVTAKWEAEKDFLAKTAQMGAVKAIAHTGTQIAQESAAKAVGAVTLGVLDGEAIKKSFERKSGRAVRPFESQFFEGVEYRTFDFTHRMVAFEESDTVTINKIVKLLRYYSSPGISGMDGYYKYPASWRIRFFQADPNSGGAIIESKWLPTLKRCVLEKVDVKSFASDAPSYHTNLAPVDVDISLSFREMEYVTRRDIIKENQPQW